MKEKNQLIETGKKAVITASAIFGISKILSVILKASEKDPKVIRQFFMISGGFAGITGIACSILYYVKNKSEASQYSSNRKADADCYTLERMADAMMGKTRKKTCQCHDDMNGDIDYSEELNPSDETEGITWIELFKSKFSMPSQPLFIKFILDGVPPGYEEPMLIHLLCMLGSMCFSKVRAKYSDGIVHAANLQVIVEGNWGSGKGKFEQIFKVLFERVIKRSIEKIENIGSSSDTSDTIIQTIGLGTSMGKYVDILANNQGCHTYLFNSEVRALSIDLRKGSGINFDFLRKAFENGDVCRNNKAKDAKNGIFPVYLNYTITGTPGDIATSFKKELEGGTISRIAWTCIPEADRSPGVLHLPSGEDLESLRDQIDDWAENYCFMTTGQSDKAVDEVLVDLGYVCDALDKWNDNQYELAIKENNPARKDVRTRMATIAFHCAIVLHMLYDRPTESQEKKHVVDLTLFIANYCIERFLHKFGETQNQQRRYNHQQEMVKADIPTTDAIHDGQEKDKITDIPTLKALHDIVDKNGQHKYGWDKLAKMSGMSSSMVRRKILDYESQ